VCRVAPVLGLPEGVTGLLFDLDGVLTQTAKVHFKAWKQTFDEFLKARDGDGFKEFTQDDYNEYVDGMPRYDGVRTFLKSRGIELPEGSPDDGPDEQTIDGVGNRKNDLVVKIIHDDGVEPYDGSVAYIKAARAAKIPMAVVSASANCKDVLKAADIIGYFDAIVDGNTTTEQHLKGKPAPDTYLAGAKALGIDPAHAVVFEDATAGVQAGHDGKFGFVVGLDRVDHAGALLDHGASIVTRDLAELLDEK
jgi:beta-phosphoglucomutase family hydrolase